MSSITAMSSMLCARKPMALLNLVYREQLFPRPAYARVFEVLLAAQDERSACRTAVALLALAHDRGCEAQLAEAIEADINAGRLPDVARLQTALSPMHRHPTGHRRVDATLGL